MNSHARPQQPTQPETVNNYRFGSVQERMGISRTIIREKDSSLWKRLHLLLLFYHFRLGDLA
jgi:hypothetical protein